MGPNMKYSDLVLQLDGWTDFEKHRLSTAILTKRADENLERAEVERKRADENIEVLKRRVQEYKASLDEQKELKYHEFVTVRQPPLSASSLSPLRPLPFSLSLPYTEVL